MGVGWVTLLLGRVLIADTRTHTALKKVTDVGLKDFSAAVGSSSTITTVQLISKHGRVWSVSAWGMVCVCVHTCVFVWVVVMVVVVVVTMVMVMMRLLVVHSERILALSRTSWLLCGCWGGAPPAARVDC